ncbi:MAG: septum formation family protein [Marmoricola sp.]
MDAGTGQQISRRERLCPRHRAAVRWASVRDRLPSELAVRVSHRGGVLERSLSCERCRALNEQPSRSVTAIQDTNVSWGAWPPTGGFGDGRAEPGRKVHLGWVMVGVSTVAIAVGLGALGVASRSETPGSTRPPADAAAGEGTGRLVDYPDLRAGDCVRDMDTEDLYFEVVSCEQPHTDEVVGAFTIPRQDWPGQKRVDQLADRGCAPRFEKYVGVPVGESSLDLYSDAPVDIGWPEDRSVVCTVTDGFGATTGSLRDAGR